MKVKVYNQRGTIVGDHELEERFFGLKANVSLVHQAVVTALSNKRQVLAHTKGRGEVRGGGRKPWRQKGTGRARHGSIRSPIWVGGGVTFGPTKERNFTKKINKKMRKIAFFSVLSNKVKEEQFVLLDKLVLAEPKTKKFLETINILKTKLKKDLDSGLLIVLGEQNENVNRSARNVPKIYVRRVESLGPLDVLKYKYLLMTIDAVKKFVEMHK